MPDLNYNPTFQITKAQLCKCMPNATHENVERFYAPLILAMSKYEINNKMRVAAFLATIALESGELRYTEEIASGEAYENRFDLGNTELGDGKRFKGRGLIQTTGRFNYRLLSTELDYNFIANPEALEKPGAASLSAGFFWWYNHLNRPADIGAFLKIQIRVNGKNKVTGLPNHWKERQEHYERIKKVLGVND